MHYNTGVYVCRSNIMLYVLGHTRFLACMGSGQGVLLWCVMWLGCLSECPVSCICLPTEQMPAAQCWGAAQTEMTLPDQGGVIGHGGGGGGGGWHTVCAWVGGWGGVHQGVVGSRGKQTRPFHA
jgi:hypothetical protein